MRNFIKLLALLGAGIAVGTVAGKLLNSEKLKNIRAIGSEVEEKSRQLTKKMTSPVEEQEINFI